MFIIKNYLLFMCRNKLLTTIIFHALHTYKVYLKIFFVYIFYLIWNICMQILVD